jgi:BirA family biotin operon repressor/biotin-[acetyl-CoA-carboxylase] ligase
VSQWGLIQRAVDEGELGRFRRLVVLPETPSTQDAARELCGGAPGLIVIAERQTAGRGRLGRAWEQHGGLAVTFVIERTPSVSEGVLPLTVGVAVADACEACAGVFLALRWPNDVVTRDSGLKVAGVLIETVGSLAFIGIGVNVADAPPHLSATSLAALGSHAERGKVAIVLARLLDAALGLGAPYILSRWRVRDCLVGTTRTFVHDGRRITGTVTAVEPTAAITVRDAEGVVHQLPAASTSLVP